MSIYATGPAECQTVELMNQYKANTISECGGPSFYILNLYLMCLSETK
jgi:hypothetical protein